MEDSIKLKIFHSIEAGKEVRSIISFKNELEENIICLGLISEENFSEIQLYNLTNNTNWGFNIFKNPVDHLVFYLEENNKYLIAARCSNDPNLIIFDYKSGEILRKITVPRTQCLLFKSFRYRGIRRFAYDVNKQDINIIDFETSGIIITINYQDFSPLEAKKIRFISNRLILILAGKKPNGHSVIRFLDVDSRQVILEHGLQNSLKETFYNITPLRNITKFCKIILNFDNDDVKSGMLCLKYNTDGTIINEKYADDQDKHKKQRFLMKWADNNYDLIDLVEDYVNVIDYSTWKTKYSFILGKSPYRIEKIKINNINYLTVMYKDGKVNFYNQKN